MFVFYAQNRFRPIAVEDKQIGSTLVRNAEMTKTVAEGEQPRRLEIRENISNATKIPKGEMVSGGRPNR
jgi:hypothetical protein